MTSRIDIDAPATITVLAGNTGISSLDTLPPDGISIADPHAGGILNVTLTAANAGAVLSASGAGGATVSSNGNTLSLTGVQTQINAALASLQISELAGAVTDTIALTATDPAALAAQTAIAVNIAANTGPAFASPPVLVTLAPNAIGHITGLVIGDPQATGLAQAGQGPSQTMSLTLAADSGILLLPGFSALDGITATGLGSGTITLDFSADRLSAVNTLLAGLEFAGPAGISGLAYSLRDLTGPFGTTVTAGNIALDIAGAAGPNGSFTTGNQTLLLGRQALQGAAATITGVLAALGDITEDGTLIIEPGASFEVPYGNLTLTGTSLDFGSLSGYGLTETGSMLMTGAAFAGAVSLGSAAQLQFNGVLTADGAATSANQLAVFLSAGAVLSGNGSLLAGNFSESGLITGPGTIEASGGGTLLIAASSIGGGAEIAAATGAVVVLGPADPLYGVFDATPLTIDSSVTLAFGSGAGPAVAGAYADALEQSGGVFVITGPQDFSGSFTGFAPGDRLIFPGLTSVSLFNIGTHSFDVGGLNADGQTVTYLINTNIPAGMSPYAGTDLAGDAEISLRDTATDIFLGGVPAAIAVIGASAGVPQPILGLEVLPTVTTSLSLTMTLTVGNGTLADAGLPSGHALTLTAPNLAAFNAELAGLTYTGNGALDVLELTSGSGFLAGLQASVVISATPAGTINGFATPATEAQIAAFTGASLQPIAAAEGAGEIAVSVLTNFADTLVLNGISGTSLLIDNAAAGIFSAPAAVTAQTGMTIGDAGGAGTLAILTQDFSVVGNAILAAATQAAGSAADISGDLGIGGTLLVGMAGAATVNLSGTLIAAATSLGTAGSLSSFGPANAAFGSLSDAGIMSLAGQTSAQAKALNLAGTLVLGGQASLQVQDNVSLSGGASLRIGPDAALSGATLSQSGGTIFDTGALSLSGALAVNAAISLAGGSISAGTISLGTAAVLSGSGIITGSLGNAGNITATNGLLTFGGNVSNNGTILIGAGAALDAVHALSGGAVSFSGTNAELTINDPGLFNATVGNMVGHDVIDLIGIAPAQVTFSNHTVTETDTLGNVIGSFTLSLASGQPAVQIVSDSYGGSLITLGDEMPCFARGTRLLTPGGYRPVESLAPGDAVVTATGARRRICWIGRRTLDFSNPKAAAARPVRIARGAFGAGLPGRALRLLPLHAVFTGGVLVPAGHLLNGATITRDMNPAAVTYFHIELDRHDAVLAEGLPCETYLDTGNRGALFDERGIRSPARRAFARRITGGTNLAAVRHRLHDIALAAGFSLTYLPALRAVAGECGILPDIELRGRKRRIRIDLPAAVSEITLLSRSVSPADTDPESEDRRALALCVDEIHARPAGMARLGAGWLDRAAGDAGMWMGDSSQILLPAGAETLTISLAAVIRRWVPPAAQPIDLSPAPS